MITKPNLEVIPKILTLEILKKSLKIYIYPTYDSKECTIFKGGGAYTYVIDCIC